MRFLIVAILAAVAVPLVAAPASACYGGGFWYGVETPVAGFGWGLCGPPMVTPGSDGARVYYEAWNVGGDDTEVSATLAREYAAAAHASTNSTAIEYGLAVTVQLLGPQKAQASADLVLP